MSIYTTTGRDLGYLVDNHYEDQDAENRAWLESEIERLTEKMMTEEFVSILPESIAEADDVTLNVIKLAFEAGDAVGFLAAVTKQYTAYCTSIVEMNL